MSLEQPVLGRYDAPEKPADNMSASPKSITVLLGQWAHGNRSALDELMPLVYDELRQLAARHLQREGRPGPTLQTTALVHEAYLRMLPSDVDIPDRKRFFALAAKVMRHILVDHARERGRRKRGGGTPPLRVEDLRDHPSPDLQLDEGVALARALEKLEQLDARQCFIVECRYLGGLDMDDIAHLLHVSSPTVYRELRTAKAWLRREMQGLYHS